MKHSRRVARSVRTIGYTGLILAASVAMAQAQSRNLADPGRVFRTSSARAKGMKIKSTKTRYNLFVTPVARWTAGSQIIGGQFRYESDNLVTGKPVAFSGMVSNVHDSNVGENRSNLQMDAEIDPYTNGRYSLNLSGQISHTMDVATFMEVAPELDITVNEFVTVAPILYWNRVKFSGVPVSTSGTTVGVTAYLTRGLWAAYPEYDFKSDFNGEDTYAVKVVKGFKNMKRDPKIFAGYAKHDVFALGMRLTLR